MGVEDEYWQLILSGMGTVEACKVVGIGRKTGYRWRTELGGFAPRRRRDGAWSERYLSLIERQRIATLRRQGRSMREIARRLGRSPSTISRELRRNTAAHDVGGYDFCRAADPESKGIVENLVGYAKDDLLVPLELDGDPWADGYAGLNERARAWGVEVNGRRHSEIHAVPIERLDSERDLLGELPSLRLEVGPAPITRKVDKLSCIRFGSARLLGAEPTHRHRRHRLGRRA